jgi:methionyl-tRNA formyltransferase
LNRLRQCRAVPADLLLGGDLGLWALHRVARDDVGTVAAPDPAVREAAAALGLDAVDDVCAIAEPAPVALSVHFPRILSPEALARYDRVLNLHPGLLPYGRGMYPVFWALWEGTPAGATLHEMVVRVDAGPVVAQLEVPYTDADTGGELHARVRAAERELFDRYWPRIAAGERLPTAPQASGGTSHDLAEFAALKESGWRDLSATELVRLARCLTFPGLPTLEVREGGRTFRLALDG